MGRGVATSEMVPEGFSDFSSASLLMLAGERSSCPRNRKSKTPQRKNKIKSKY